MATTIVLTNQKGGVGKTTTTASLVAGMMKKKYKVLSIDLDPQGNLGFSLGLNIEEGYSIYEVLTGEIGIKEAIRSTEDYGDIVTSNILLSNADVKFQSNERERLLKNALEEVAFEYDYILIDTPPALNILTINGYVAADYLIIPMAGEILSLVGISQIKDTIDSIKKSFNPNLKVLGIALIRFNERTNLAKEVEEMANAVAEQIGTKLFKTKVRLSVMVAECPAHGMSILDYAPRCNPALDYKRLVDEVIYRIEKAS